MRACLTLARLHVQHIYVPVLYAVLGLKTRLQDITILYVPHVDVWRFTTKTAERSCIHSIHSSLHW